MKKLIATALGGALLGGAGTLAIDASEAEKNVFIKEALLSENVELHTRLNEPPTWDASLVSAEEMSEAYADVAEKYEVTVSDLDKAEGNVQAAIQSKIPGLLCTKL